MNTEKLLLAVQRVRTPLALAGVTLVIFYLLSRQLLGMNVFANVGSEKTAELLAGLLAKVFWLAVTTIVLGVGSYITALILKHRVKARSRIELLDARLEPHTSPYEEDRAGPEPRITPKRRNGSEKP